MNGSMGDEENKSRYFMLKSLSSWLCFDLQRA